MENKCEKCGISTNYGETHSFIYGSAHQATVYGGGSSTTATTWKIYPDPMDVYLCNKCVAIYELSIKERIVTAAFLAWILGIATFFAGVFTVIDALKGKSGILCVSSLVLVMAIATIWLWAIARKTNARQGAELAKDVADIEQEPIESIKRPFMTLEAKKLRLKWVVSFRANELKRVGADLITWSLGDPALDALLARLELSKYSKR